MAQQVKFYSTSSLPASPNAGGVYFVNGGELYKGSQRFGLGRVTVAESTTGITGMARGDVVVTGNGAGWVYVGSGDGEGWKPLGGDTTSLQSSWRADIKTWTASLAAGGAGSYITGITQTEDGKVSASASNFDTDVKTAVGDGAASSSSNGVIVSVTTTSGKVTGVSVTAPAAKTYSEIGVGEATSYIYNVSQDESGQVSALAKPFPTLATGTSDGTVKLGSGADAKVSGWDDLVSSVSDNTTAISGLNTTIASVSDRVTGIESIVNVANGGTVTASSGVFTNLTVSDTATFSVTNVSASSLTVNGSTIEQLADKQIAAIAQSTGIGASNGITVSVTTKGGSVTAVSVDATAFGNVMKFRDVVASTASISDPASGDIVVIGANPTGGAVTGQEYIYDGTKWELIGDQKTYAINAYTSTASVYTGVTNVPGALNAVGAAADTFKAALDAKVTASADVSAAGKASNLVTAGAVAGYVTQEINALSLGDAAKKGVANTIAANGTSLPTESAVAAYVSTVVSGLDATPTDAGTQGVSVAVVEADGVITGVTTTVTKDTLNSTLGTTNVADKTIATSIGATGADTALATEKAVRDAINDVELVWLDASGDPIGS